MELLDFMGSFPVAQKIKEMVVADDLLQRGLR